jgi:hypothetical protein
MASKCDTPGINSVFQHVKKKRVVADLVLCDGCGCDFFESDVRRCTTCALVVCFAAGGECMSPGGVGVGDVDVCNACMDQHYQCCNACGDATHMELLVHTDDGYVCGKCTAL